jgi:RNA polymerase sigma-70 factor, ECF subfamily
VVASPRALLDRARNGDAKAFEEITRPYVRELHLHCYRMLGSFHDAEDLVQETLLRAWGGIHAYRGDATVRTWLYRVATHACLDVLKSGARRILPSSHVPPADPERPGRPAIGEPLWLEPYPDRLLDELADPADLLAGRESVQLAFLAAIQLLSPRERAALLLREVVGFAADETAGLLGTTVASVNSSLQRGRARLAEARAASALPASHVGGPGERDLVDRYVEAFERGDVPALVRLLRDDVTMTMPPDPAWFRGRDDVGRFLDRWVFGTRGPMRLIREGANRQPGVAVYERWVDGNWHGLSLQVLSFDESAIAEITGFVGTEMFGSFGLDAVSSRLTGRPHEHGDERQRG